MRIWSIHPKYLDSKRLTAVWRETLLARAVLEGKTKSYLNHPQLIRFKNSENSLLFINTYLYHIHQESILREFNFDIGKVNKKITNKKLAVNDRQISYELEHLKKKLNYPEHLNIKKIIPHPIFHIVKGDIEVWEKVR